MTEPSPDLVRKLGAKSGNPKEREEQFLSSEERELLFKEGTRLYDEYVQAVMESLPEEERPDEAALQQPGFTYMMEMILEVGYELGQEFGFNPPTGFNVEIDPETANTLLRYALRKALSEGVL